MKKSMVVVLVVAATGLAARPAARERIGESVEPYMAQAHVVPVEVARTALEPIFRWQVRGQLRLMRRQLEQRAKVGEKLPSERQFEQYLNQNQLTGRSGDPWGSSFALVKRREFVAVVSPGPDRQLYTSDDLLERFHPQQ